MGRVRASVQGEDAGDLDGRVARGRESASVGLGNEGDFGEIAGFEDILVHLGVSAFFAAVAAGRANHDVADNGLRGAVKVDPGAGEMEDALDAVRSGERKGDGTGARVGDEGLALRVRSKREGCHQKNKQHLGMDFHGRSPWEMV
jgi:hypothetical protein